MFSLYKKIIWKDYKIAGSTRHHRGLQTLKTFEQTHFEPQRKLKRRKEEKLIARS